MKYSEGPWWACCKSITSNHHYVFSNSGNKEICVINNNDPINNKAEYCDMSETVTLEESCANAYLIETAPELLESLKDVLASLYECPPFDKSHFTDHMIEAAEKAQMIIDKAQGNIKEDK